jgi:hypothetical protein
MAQRTLATGPRFKSVFNLTNSNGKNAPLKWRINLDRNLFLKFRLQEFQIAEF